MPFGGNNFTDGISMGYIANLNDYSEYLEEAFAEVGDYAKVGGNKRPPLRDPGQ